jgi:hypothetical protein
VSTRKTNQDDIFEKIFNFGKNSLDFKIIFMCPNSFHKNRKIIQSKQGKSTEKSWI